MLSRGSRRSELLDRMADFVLEDGLAAANLRPLAKACGTSDRMLLYYFADKDELLTAVFEHLATRLSTLLDANGMPVRKSYGLLLAELWAATRGPALQPYILFFLELATSAARGREPHRTVAMRISDGFITWTAERLDIADKNEQRAKATLLLAIIDGLSLLQGSGHADEANAAAATG
jgi:AcrR family transcriptional regulator